MYTRANTNINVYSLSCNGTSDRFGTDVNVGRNCVISFDTFCDNSTSARQGLFVSSIQYRDVNIGFSSEIMTSSHNDIVFSSDDDSESKILILPFEYPTASALPISK